MGWLGDLWKDIKGHDADDMIFVDLTPGEPPQPPLVADECYVELYVDALRLRNVRRFATRFHGVVYSFVTLSFDGTANIKLPAISKPENLAQLDPDGLAKVITVNKQMMGAIPWRGGPLLLELGLFSVKGGNLLTPVVDFLTEISSVAGISFAGKIAPFAPLMAKGMDMLAGQTSDVALEVGLDTALALDRPGTFAIVAAPKNRSIETAKLTIDRDRKLLLGGEPLKQAYCVFSIRSSDRKADFGEIPELKERFAKLRDAIRTGDEKAARDALTAFRLTAMTCPDLIRQDARRLVDLARQQVDEALGQGPVLAAVDETIRMPLPPSELAALPLYGN